MFTWHGMAWQTYIFRELLPLAVLWNKQHGVLPQLPRKLGVELHHGPT